MRRKSTQLVKTFQEYQLSLALAESITCGLASYQLSTIKGTTAVFRGSLVCYDPHVKKGLLGVTDTMLDKHTAESQIVTDTMAMNLKKVIPADVHGAITGLAAAGGSETPAKPVGTIYLSVFYKNKLTGLRKNFRGTPSEIKKKACDALFDLLIKVIR